MPDRPAQFRLWQFWLDRFEYRLILQVARARNTLIREASDSYEQNSGNIPGWINERHRNRLRALLNEHYDVVIPHFGKLALKQVKSRRVERKAAETLFLSLMKEWASTQALARARMIAATDAGDIRDAIQNGLEEGLGTAEIARNISKVSSLTGFRAATVARTETNSAATYGAIETVRNAEQELGVRMLKAWLPTRDDRTREDHAAMADHPAIPLNEKFDVGGVQMDRPGDTSAPPEQTINCRCALVFEEAE